jgi:hypothetical protein
MNINKADANMSDTNSYGITLRHKTSVRRFMLSSMRSSPQNLEAIIEQLNAEVPNYENASDYFRYCEAYLQDHGFVVVRE